MLRQKLTLTLLALSLFVSACTPVAPAPVEPVADINPRCPPCRFFLGLYG